MPNHAFSLMKRLKCQRKGPRLVRTWFNQPGRQLRRHNKRIKRAERLFPRPAKALRPIVQCCTVDHNMKTRLGRGFSLKEIEAINLTVCRARQIGIAVDKRRKNKTQQGLDRNIERLKEYMSRLVIFKKGESKEEIAKYIQVKQPLPLVKTQPVIEIGRVQDQPKMEVYKTLHEMKLQKLTNRIAHRAKVAAAAKKK